MDFYCFLSRRGKKKKNFLCFIAEVFLVENILRLLSIKVSFDDVKSALEDLQKSVKKPKNFLDLKGYKSCLQKYFLSFVELKNESANKSRILCENFDL